MYVIAYTTLNILNGHNCVATYNYNYVVPLFFASLCSFILNAVFISELLV